MEVAQVRDGEPVKGGWQSPEWDVAPNDLRCIRLGETVDRQCRAYPDNGTRVQEFSAADFVRAEQRQVRPCVSKQSLRYGKILLDVWLDCAAFVVMGNINAQVEHEGNNRDIHNQYPGVQQGGVTNDGTDFQWQVKGS